MAERRGLEMGSAGRRPDPPARHGRARIWVMLDSSLLSAEELQAAPHGPGALRLALAVLLPRQRRHVQVVTNRYLDAVKPEPCMAEEGRHPTAEPRHDPLGGMAYIEQAYTEHRSTSTACLDDGSIYAYIAIC
ncbi:hypothetical protein GCM10027176_48910 [Actinoallomurus bryophytorum]